MFTGIVEETGTIDERRRDDDGAAFAIHTSMDLETVEIGESIAIDGACLTVASLEEERFWVELSPETLARTTLGERREGDGVHLERALRADDRLGGHFVQGHVDGVGRLVDVADDGDARLIEIEVAGQWARYLVEKGSIAIDGVSLTINEVDGDRFSVAIIPHTDDVTKLGGYGVGDEVNIEVDVLGKYVEKLVTDEE